MLESRQMNWWITALVLVFFSGCKLVDPRPVFRYRSGPVATLDPAEAADYASLREAARAYQTPLKLDRTARGFGTQPWLLERAPRVTKNGRRLELRFRSRVRFQESRRLFRGPAREVTGCDWVKSILRHGDYRIGSHWAPYLSARIEGFREWIEMVRSKGDEAYFRLPSGLSCNQQDAAVTLKFSDPEFSYFLAHPASSLLPVDEMLKEKWDVSEKALGSSGYRMSGSRSGTLKWKSINPDSPIKAIEVDTSEDAYRDWDLFMRGSLDIVEVPLDLQSTVLQPGGTLVSKWAERGYQLLKIQRADLVFVGIQMKHPILGKKRGVRRALGMALEGNTIVDQVFGGRAVQAKAAIPPGIPGYLPQDVKIARIGELAPAQDLLGFNGYPHGGGLPEFRMGCLANPVEQELCRAVAARWELLGVKTAIVTMDQLQRRAEIVNGSIHFWPVTWVADLPGPVTYLETFDSGAGIPEIPSPSTEAVAYRRALGRARSLPVAQSTAAVSDASAILRREAPAAFIGHRFQYWLVRPGISGLNWQDFSWHDWDELRKLDSSSN